MEPVWTRWDRTTVSASLDLKEDIVKRKLHFVLGLSLTLVRMVAHVKIILHIIPVNVYLVLSDRIAPPM